MDIATGPTEIPRSHPCLAFSLSLMSSKSFSSPTTRSRRMRLCCSIDSSGKDARSASTSCSVHKHWGAYSLARSTLGQMAIRIALQCSEADAHLILSEDNTAARLLTRPGEAIYNDANGRIEGNNPFQIVWLPDHEREEFLHRLGERFQKEPTNLPAPVIFEGNAPSSLSTNPQVVDAMAGKSAARRILSAWLGEPIEIKPPTAIEFPRQSGSHLAVLGQDGTSARGVFVSTLVSFALQSRLGKSARSIDPASNGNGSLSLACRLYLLDGTDPAQVDTQGGLVLLADIAKRAGIEATSIDRRRLTDSLSEIAEIIARRQLQESPDPEEVFLFIYDLGDSATFAGERMISVSQ